VKSLGRHGPILMFHVKNVGIIACACTCNGKQGRLLCERAGTVSTKMGGAVETALDSKLLPYSVTRCLQQHSLMGSTAIRVNSDLTQHWYSLLQQSLKVY
jgi:hypothetical protein